MTLRFWFQNFEALNIPNESSKKITFIFVKDVYKFKMLENLLSVFVGTTVAHKKTGLKI